MSKRTLWKQTTAALPGKPADPLMQAIRTLGRLPRRTKTSEFPSSQTVARAIMQPVCLCRLTPFYQADVIDIQLFTLLLGLLVGVILEPCRASREMSQRKTNQRPTAMQRANTQTAG